MNREQRDITTQEKILQAAEKVFQEKGFDGARMQEIADKADINKGLLHYYFRTKNRLFEAIFIKAFNHIVSSVKVILSSDRPLMEKLELFIDKYIDVIMKNPAIPRFVLNELNTNPNKFVNKMLAQANRPDLEGFFNTVDKEIKAGLIKPIDPRHLMIDIVGMCIFPFIGRPMLQGILQLDNQEFKALLKERKAHVAEIVRRTIEK